MAKNLFSENGKKKPKNNLGSEKSLYLRQHAYQPVDWYPWKEEVFEKAKKEHKPIFLSIGYSTCHWCHVMAHESFDDPAIAQLINQVFIPIKVDREERPDIDKIYMQVALMMTGRGGWPLTIFLTPEKKPFFAATYIPRENQYGQRGLREIVLQVKDLWKNRQELIKQQSEQLLSLLQKNSVTTKGESLTREILAEAYKHFSVQFDRKFGGFGRAPKFPSPHQLLFLLRYGYRTGDRQALKMVEVTLQSMQKGGIFDQIGFGFHRYATDAAWMVPHFEKMLYDQALLVIAYLEAFQVTGKDIYQETARKILDYVLRDMTSQEGGFYSAEDADSEGEEGKFYLWTEKELKEVLEKDELAFVQQYFHIKPEGNLAAMGHAEEIFGKQNIFYQDDFKKAVMDNSKEETKAEKEKWNRIRGKLYKARTKRVYPEKDTKILTDWNGLMIAALAKAGRILAEDCYIQAAKKATNFIFSNLAYNQDQLFHRYWEGDTGIAGYLDDYAFLIWGLLELYESTFSAAYLQKALDLNQVMMSDFWDKENGGFYFTSKQAEPELVRQKEVHDGAIPSGNSVAFCNLLRLAHLTGNEQLSHQAYELVKAFSPMIEQNPPAYTFFLIGVDLMIGPTYEVIIIGNQGKDDTRKMLRVLQKNYLPRKVVIFRSAENKVQQIDEMINFTLPSEKITEKATAYICKDYVCMTPTSDIQKMLALLGYR